MHFFVAQMNGADDACFKQFGSEVAVPRKLPSGEVVHVHGKRGPNEAVDLEVYAYTALHIPGDARCASTSARWPSDSRRPRVCRIRRRDAASSPAA